MTTPAQPARIGPTADDAIAFWDASMAAGGAVNAVADMLLNVLD